MATLIVHVGMHKTGTSSIQDTLATLPRGRAPRLLALGPPNMSGVIRKAFQPEERLARSYGEEVAARFGADRPRLLNWLETTLRQSRDEDCILSAESFSLLSAEELQSFLALVHHQAVRFIAYLREPNSAMSSALQQRVKAGGLRKFDPLAWVPKYEASLAKFTGHDFSAFLYDRDRLRNGCVVQDFCGRIDVTIAPEEVRNSNESIGRDALSLIYCRNHWRGLQRKPRQHSLQLVEALASLGRTRIELDADLVRDAIDQSRADIAWAEQLLGAPFPVPKAKPGAGAIRREADLMQISDAAADWLRTHEPSWTGDRDPAAVGAAVDRIGDRLGDGRRTLGGRLRRLVRLD